MRVRSGQLGFGTLDYEGDETAESAVRAAAVWRGDGPGAALGRALLDGLRRMAAVVETPQGQRSELGDALSEAIETAEGLTRASAGVPDADQWRRLRAVASGALPRPTRREQAATRRRMAATGYVAPGSSDGRDGERILCPIAEMREAASHA